ncbi:GNAT family N-acetyltransferase [Ancylobacter mangrovi]|uniref:GNAT family N-acetyltransferase n=1 Tax=Ancylobacter mangrovi TaxID=2972472 RepID=UPI0035A95C51
MSARNCARAEDVSGVLLGPSRCRNWRRPGCGSPAGAGRRRRPASRLGDPEATRLRDLPPSVDEAKTFRRIRSSTASDPNGHAARAMRAAAARICRAWSTPIPAGPGIARWRQGGLVPEARGEGLMAEAMRAPLADCFGVLETRRVEAAIEPDNSASERLAGGRVAAGEPAARAAAGLRHTAHRRHVVAAACRSGGRRRRPASHHPSRRARRSVL